MSLAKHFTSERTIFDNAYLVAIERGKLMGYQEGNRHADTFEYQDDVLQITVGRWFNLVVFATCADIRIRLLTEDTSPCVFANTAIGTLASPTTLRRGEWIAHLNRIAAPIRKQLKEAERQPFKRV